MSNSERMMEVLAPAFGSLDPVVDETVVDGMVKALEPIATEDFTCAMVALNVTQEFQGPKGIASAWSDWLEAYTELRFRIEEFRDIGENVLMHVTQVGITRHDSVKVEQPSAAVWMFRGNDLYRVEFHLDRKAAERSARDSS